MKVSKRQLRRIIKEEKSKVLREQLGVDPEAASHTIFNADALYDLLGNEVNHYLDNYAGGRGEVMGVLGPEEMVEFEAALTEATRMIIAEYKS